LLFQASSLQFRKRLNMPESPGEVQRVERVLAGGRVFLATSALLAIYLDPTEPTRYAALAYGLLVAYVVYSIAILVLVRLHQDPDAKFRLTVHAADIAWPTVLTFFTEGPNSPFFLFFVFVLLAAAYRWGFRETVLTAGASIALLLAEAIAFTFGPLNEFLVGGVVLNRLIMRAAYLLILGFLLGYLAETEKRLRVESALLPRILGRAKVEAGLRGTLHGVLDDLMHIFEARQALFVIREASSGRVFLWQARQEGGQAQSSFENTELLSAERESYLFPTSAHSWHASRPSGPWRATTFDILALDAEGRRMSGALGGLPDSFVVLHDFQKLLAASFHFGEQWFGRVYLLDPEAASDRETHVRFLQNLVRQVGPAIYNVYLLRRLRARASAVERARMARELHDGTIQSLIAVEMRLDVARRKKGAQEVAEELEQVQQLLRKEILNLRELMQQMRPAEVDPRKLMEYIADLVDKFQRETGIAARLDSDLPELALPARLSRDVARIVQEGLINVLKHSDARSVLVRLTAENGQCRLVITDDGRGFDFVGRLSQEELEAGRIGPRVIRERVRAIGGSLTIESFPGRGARLEISFPQRAYG